MRDDDCESNGPYGSISALQYIHTHANTCMQVLHIYTFTHVHVYTYTYTCIEHMHITDINIQAHVYTYTYTDQQTKPAIFAQTSAYMLYRIDIHIHIRCARTHVSYRIFSGGERSRDRSCCMLVADVETGLRFRVPASVFRAGIHEFVKDSTLRAYTCAENALV